MAANSRQRKPKHYRTVNNDQSSGKAPDKSFSSDGYVYVGFIVFIALSVAYGCRYHVSSMFENDRHFSHLSTLERELTFRTEMGLYYSYFKTIITSNSFLEGLDMIRYDNITEYPSTINTLKRFNLYPEVVLGIAYRVYQGVSDYFGHPTKVCWRVNRGEGLSPVESCEGLGEPAYFYTESVFLLSGLMMAVFFLFGTYLSGSILGGVITVSCFLFNHGECTRVQWTPPLRESFGYPFFVLEMFLVTIVLRKKHTSFYYSWIIAAGQICFMLSWQFAQFALLTQTLAVLGTYVLGYTSIATLKVILLGQTIGLLSSFILLFGNEMLLTSFFASCLVAAWVLVTLGDKFKEMPHLILRLPLQATVFVVMAILVKLASSKILQLEDDAHISEIFYSKFSDFQNFHTMLYTCAKEFDFLETETYLKLMQTLLLPSAILTLFIVAFKFLTIELSGSNSYSNGSANETNPTLMENSTKPSIVKSKPHADVLYHAFQLLAFTAMAIMVMRLKLFWTPHLCLFTSLLASRQFIPYGKKEVHFGVLVGLLAVMSFYGLSNIEKQRNIKGEFSNPNQEELVEWINGYTAKNAVFAGPMPTMATIKLCTSRPIVNHPHYEDAGLRARTKLVYTLYSRKPLSEVRKNLEFLGVHYVILEHSWCSRRSRPGCGMAEIWDLEDEENRGKPPACHIVESKPAPHFKIVFENKAYKVLKLI